MDVNKEIFTFVVLFLHLSFGDHPKKKKNISLVYETRKVNDT